MDFVHLHTFSSYSLLTSAVRLDRLIDAACADGQPALALTDFNNLFAGLEFSEKCVAQGIQPIMGCQLDVDFRSLFGRDFSAKDNAIFPLVFLAHTPEGRNNLLALVSRFYMDNDPDSPLPALHPDWIRDLNAGLICLSGGDEGVGYALTRKSRSQLVRAAFEMLRDCFGDRFYVELNRYGRPDELMVEHDLISLAQQLDVGVVATHPFYFMTPQDYAAHDALMAIKDGVTLSDDHRRRVTPNHVYKTRAEVCALFADLPDALCNAVDIARRCAVRIETSPPILPRFSALEGSQNLLSDGEIDGEVALLKSQAEAGLKHRLSLFGCAAGVAETVYYDRLAYELDVINNMGFPGYFLIVADFIGWAKEHGIPVGPGRGSGAGSLVAYALEITDLDPVRFNLLFERFLNPERVSMPDFDIDFCQERRDEVIGYVKQKYGADKVAQIITFGTLQARGVLRDVGRVLGMPYGQVDRICKLVPQNPANPVTLQQAVDEESRLQDVMKNEEGVDLLISHALKLEGLHRHASTHAAGLVIGDRPLQELVPLYRDPRSDMPITQYNMKWVEKAGLVKFDFLGLKTLTVIQHAVAALNKRGVDLDIAQVPLDDAPTFDMLSRGDTVGVFQLESAGMRKALIDMGPDRFEDIIAIVALYRPGPMANIPTYCARKHGDEEVDVIHPKLDGILRETFGVIIYQEQVMQIAQVLAGYSLGEADLLRRAMGKKIKEEMEQQRTRFVDGAVERGVETAHASEIFDLLAKFADYGFNKSHAAAYAYVAYQTAFLKANYPAEFLAASMSYDLDNTDKISVFVQDAKRLGIRIHPPHVNSSGVMFEAQKDEIFYALSALKGLGSNAAESLVQVRGDAPFKDVHDFIARIAPTSALNKKAIETLIAAGGFDALCDHRAQLYENLSLIMSDIQSRQSDALSGQAGLFGDTSNAPQSVQYPPVPPWPDSEKLQKELTAIGFFMSGHPLDSYRDFLQNVGWPSLSTFLDQAKTHGAFSAQVAVTVVDVQERRTRSGGKMGIAIVSDASLQIETVVFSDLLQDSRDLLSPGTDLMMVLAADANGDDVRVRTEGIKTLSAAAERSIKGLDLVLTHPVAWDQLTHILTGAQNDGGVHHLSFVLDLVDGQARATYGHPARFNFNQQHLESLKAVKGVQRVGF